MPPPLDPPPNGDPPDDDTTDDDTTDDDPSDDDAPTATSTAVQYPTSSPTPTPTPLPVYIYIVNERIFVESVNSDISYEHLEMLELDKHPDLQGGRFAARVWRSNPQCTHRVAAGENLFRLALRYHTTPEALKRHNNLSSDLISIGQELVLPVCPQHMMELANTWICFKAPGALVFIDTASSPPAVYPLGTYTEGGFTCAAISRPGTVVLTDRR